MKKIISSLLILLLSVDFIYADVATKNVILQDEGTTVSGAGRILNFTGAGVVVTFAGGKYVITIAGGAGSGDVTDVGDCADGACLDGTSDGGTWIKFYDAQGAGQLITGNLTAARVWTLPDETGALLITELDPTVDTSAEIQAIIGAGIYEAANANIQSHISDNTQAHSDYVINTGDIITGATTINDNNAAGSTLLTIGDATDADSVAIFGDLTVTGGDITLGTSAILSGGDTTSLNLIDAIDATTETTLETALDIGGEVTSTGIASTVIADSVAVTSWNLTTPTLTTSATVTDAFTLGLGAGKGLIQFDDETIDFVSFSNCKVGIGTVTPWEALVVVGDQVNSDASPQITFRDSSDNTAFSWHYDTADSTWGVYQLWLGTDTGTGFSVGNAGYPVMYSSSTGNVGFPKNVTVSGTLIHSFSKSFTIISPVATDDYPAWRVPYAITITAIHVQCTGGTNIIGGLDEYNSAGATIVAAVDSDITATAGNSVNDDGSLTNGGIAAGNYIFWHTTSISGTPTSVTVTFEYTE